MQQIFTIILAILAIAALVGVAIWLVQRFGTGRGGASTQRGRMPRLAVIDAAVVDGKRRLVLIRRDNVEHLLMIGGANDIIVEPNIVRAIPAREQMPQRPGAAPELPPRIAPLPEALGWSDGEAAREALEPGEPQMPEPPPRPARPSFAEEMRRPQPSAPERRGALTDFAAEPLVPRPEPRAEIRPEIRPEAARPEPVPPRMPRPEPAMPRPPRVPEAPKAAPVRVPERAAAPPPPPPPAAPPVSSADQSLAEMAQRLEAALRRPATETAPPVAPEPPAAAAPAPPARPSRSEPAPAPAKSAPEKSTFENLEDEMASLLGRPKPPSSS